MADQSECTRRTVLTGAAAVAASLALPAPASAATSRELAVLDVQLGERLDLFRTLRRQELARLWQRHELRFLSDYESAARDWADARSGLTATVKQVNAIMPVTAEDQEILERASGRAR